MIHRFFSISLLAFFVLWYTSTPGQSGTTSQVIDADERLLSISINITTSPCNLWKTNCPRILLSLHHFLCASNFLLLESWATIPDTKELLPYVLLSDDEVKWRRFRQTCGMEKSELVLHSCENKFVSLGMSFPNDDMMLFMF